MLERLHKPVAPASPSQQRYLIQAFGVERHAADDNPSGAMRKYRWLCWSLMLLAVATFAGADVAANWLEARGRGQAIDPVTATGWVRLGIKTTWYALPLVALTIGWLVWHFVVGAFAPGLPL